MNVKHVWMFLVKCKCCFSANETPTRASLRWLQLRHTQNTLSDYRYLKYDKNIVRWLLKETCTHTQNEKKNKRNDLTNEIEYDG